MARVLGCGWYKMECLLLLFKSWWRHQMETFSGLLAICAGNSPVTGELPAQRPVTRSFDVFFDLPGWVNNREASDFRRHRTHYDVTVMKYEVRTCGHYCCVKCHWSYWVFRGVNLKQHCHYISIYCLSSLRCLTHRGPVKHICELDCHWFRKWLAF